jgi:hypothetical protein
VGRRIVLVQAMIFRLWSAVSEVDMSAQTLNDGDCITASSLIVTLLRLWSVRRSNDNGAGGVRECDGRSCELRSRTWRSFTWHRRECRGQVKRTPGSHACMYGPRIGYHELVIGYRYYECITDRGIKGNSSLNIFICDLLQCIDAH